MKMNAGFLSSYAALLAMAFCASPAAAQKKKTEFNGRKFELAELKQGDQAQIPVRAFNGKKLVVVEGNPEEFGKGVALGNNRFLVSVPESATTKQLFEKGRAAQQFVLTNKSGYVQALRIKEFIDRFQT